jgi:hypothetical protein
MIPKKGYIDFTIYFFVTVNIFQKKKKMVL